jgi:ornithine cyclodeaminase/alanine dehydrogenase-like protein (mu-crystallin family)
LEQTSLLPAALIEIIERTQMNKSTLVGQSLLYLSRKDVEMADVPMVRIIDSLLTMFREKGNGRVEMPPKPGIHPLPDAFIHAMPSYIPAMRSAGLKWVSGYPQNQAKGLPYITGLIILNDDETGFPYCVMDGTWVTAMRTGAATAVSAKYFARPESHRVGILACGVQGRSNLQALSCCFDIQEVYAYDIVHQKAIEYAKEISEQLNISVTAVTRPEEAVRNMDIVVTSGPILKNPSPPIEESWFDKGAFASLVDFDSYWKPEALLRADVISTDDVGQLLYYKQAGYFKSISQRERIVDLGDVVVGKAPKRQSEEQRIIAINLGLSLDDMATAPLVFEAALEKNLGVVLEL